MGEIKNFISEKDFEQFSEIENFLKNSRPEFNDSFEKELLLNFKSKKSDCSFYTKTAVALGITIVFTLFSILNYNKPEKIENFRVSERALNEVISSFNDSENVNVDLILQKIEGEMKNENLSNDYFNETFGGDYEESYS
jgi:hypothetical protein